MNRRDLFKLLGGSIIAGSLWTPDDAVWRPQERKIFLPPRGGWGGDRRIWVATGLDAAGREEIEVIVCTGWPKPHWIKDLKILEDRGPEFRPFTVPNLFSGPAMVRLPTGEGFCTSAGTALTLTTKSATILDATPGAIS